VIDVGEYDAPVQLKDLVTTKALTQSTTNPTITKHDVLRALKTDEHHMFPAPCLIKPPGDVVQREQESELIAKISNANSVPVIVHADGGVGKSIFATRIKLQLPSGWRTGSS
jgi:hypothetical protein